MVPKRPGPATWRAGVGPRAGGELTGGDAADGDGSERDNIGSSDQRGGEQHGAGIVALRVLHLLGDGGGVVPSHVVP
jgi:hypothetical protein